MRTYTPRYVGEVRRTSQTIKYAREGRGANGDAGRQIRCEGVVGRAAGDALMPPKRLSRFASKTTGHHRDQNTREAGILMRVVVVVTAAGKCESSCTMITKSGPVQPDKEKIDWSQDECVKRWPCLFF
jgi:hypothetical protein